MFIITNWKANRKQKQEAARQQRERDHADSLALTRNALEAAGKIATPLERIQQLKKVERDIEDKISLTTSGINKEAGKEGRNGFINIFGSSLSAATALFAATAVLAPIAGAAAVALAIAITLTPTAGLLVGLFAVDSIANKAFHRMRQEAAGFYNELNTMKKTAADLAATTVHEHYAAVAKSPAVLALPGIRDAFTSAAVARAANDDPQPTTAAPRAAAANNTPTI